MVKRGVCVCVVAIGAEEKARSSNKCAFPTVHP